MAAVRRLRLAQMATLVVVIVIAGGVFGGGLHRVDVDQRRR